MILEGILEFKVKKKEINIMMKKNFLEIIN